MKPKPDYLEFTPEDLPQAWEVAARTGMAVRIGTTRPAAYLVPAALYHQILRRAYRPTPGSRLSPSRTKESRP